MNSTSLIKKATLIGSALIIMTVPAFAGYGPGNGTGNGGNGPGDGTGNGPGTGDCTALYSVSPDLNTPMIARGGNGNGGHGSGDGTGNGGDGPEDGTGNGAKTGDCTNV